MDLTVVKVVSGDFDQVVADVRQAFADNGFGILTEIDMQKTLKEKLGVEMPRQLILGACRPPLAHQAVMANPSVAALLPCNVVVRESDDGCVVEAVDPSKLLGMAGGTAGLDEVAQDASARVHAAMDALA